ncbi:MAG: hypothetical protein U9M92_03085 [Patescibacteria group bacterium]|nr:hypothetical protein [Patescibacteria group bacterium]
MSNMEFNPDDKDFYSDLRQRAAAPRGGLMGWFMRVLGTDSESKANGVMLAVAVLFFLASIIIFWRFL